jgi:RNA polymerase sigma factor (sigma-70 family)
MAHLFRAVCALDTENQNDGQLLGQFLARQDKAAFAALVRRHGPMVLAVCQRILGNASDAEDAFQATFLVLVRKAAALVSRRVLGDWLHGVARRTALHARRLAALRHVKEQQMARPEAQSETVRDDWLPLLDEALSRLPAKYRLPIVLCDLESRSRREVAQRLGWPEGTVAGRLSRGRALLAKQLTRRGLLIWSGSLAAALAPSAASATVPSALVESTVHGDGCCPGSLAGQGGRARRIGGQGDVPHQNESRKLRGGHGLSRPGCHSRTGPGQRTHAGQRRGRRTHQSEPAER